MAHAFLQHHLKSNEQLFICLNPRVREYESPNVLLAGTGIVFGKH
jgi:single-stranded DNA-specific DHH superfamily exonuclease